MILRDLEKQVGEENSQYFEYSSIFMIKEVWTAQFFLVIRNCSTWLEHRRQCMGWGVGGMEEEIFLKGKMGRKCWRDVCLAKEDRFLHWKVTGITGSFKRGMALTYLRGEESYFQWIFTNLSGILIGWNGQPSRLGQGLYCLSTSPFCACVVTFWNFRAHHLLSH